MTAPGAQKRILVIQLRQLGDVLLTLPALEALRRAYPSAEIDFLVEEPGARLVEGDPAVTEVLTYDPAQTLPWLLAVRARRYDLVVDFLGNPRSALLAFASGAPLRAGPGHVFHRWTYNRTFPPPRPDVYLAQAKVDNLAAALAVPPIKDARPRIVVPEDAAREAGRIWKELGLDGAPFVLGVFPASRRAARRWPPEHFAALLRSFHAARPAHSLLFWGPGEEDLVRRIAGHAGAGCMAIPTVADLKVLAGLMRRLDFGIGCDNGPRHMAAAVGVPTLTISGPTQPLVWNAPEPGRRPFIRRDELFCIGCDLNECPFKTECMTGLAPERVLKALLAAVERLPAREAVA